jgi:hypothetical protein
MPPAAPVAVLTLVAGTTRKSSCGTFIAGVLSASPSGPPTPPSIWATLTALLTGEWDGNEGSASAGSLRTPIER